MTIEVKEKGTRGFYKELVNITTQYRQLLYKPNDKLKDNFTRYIVLAAAMALIFLMNLYGSIKGSAGTMSVLAMAFAGLACVATILVLARMYKMLNGLIADDHPAVLTLDENGAEIEKKGIQTMRIAWDNVAFVRTFPESTCFFAKDLSGMVLAVNNSHRKEIMDYIKENNKDVLVIKPAVR